MRAVPRTLPFEDHTVAFEEALPVTALIDVSRRSSPQQVSITAGR